jgi:two-component sensor histidine kinase
MVRNLKIDRLLQWCPVSDWRRYGIGLAAFVVSTSVRALLDFWLASDRGFILFIPAILGVTFFAGLGPAILTAVLSGAVLWYLFLPPFYSLQLSLDGAVGLTTFAFGSATGIALVHWLRILISQAEAERARSEALAASLSADLHHMTRLNELGNQLVREGGNIGKCLNEILDIAIAIAGAKKGNVQLLDLNLGVLIIAAQRGFHEFFLKYFEKVRNDGSVCALAMQARQQLVVEDVKNSELFAAHPVRNVLLAEDVQAVISTPLTSSTGVLLGIISVHFDEPHRATEQQLRLLNLLTRQAADYLERQRTAQIEEILVREVQHRSNNLLSVVQAIAHRSLSNKVSLADAKKAFEARLHALARANRQLTKANWSGVDLKEIVRLELEPFGERVALEGIDVILGAEHAQNLSLALHELATNACKYGALSNQLGRVMVSWAITPTADRKNTLHFKWQERHGPPVEPPKAAGFGTSLLKAMFVNVRFDYAREGLVCEIETLLEENKLDSASAANLEVTKLVESD